MTRRKHNNRSSVQDRKSGGEGKNLQHPQHGKVIKEKFQEAIESKYYHLQPRTINQERAMNFQKSCQVVLLLGASGVGKTLLACVHAANQLTLNKIDRIVLLRPPEGLGKGIGYRKGEVEEKLSGPYQSMIDPLKMALGSAVFDTNLKHGNIVMEPMEDVRGRSYRRSVIIVDEASNTSVKEMQTLITRIGDGSQLIFCGDTAPWQKDIKGESGLDYIVKSITKLRSEKPSFLDDEDKDNLYTNIGIVHFTRDDVVRSGVTKLFVKAFDEGY